MLIIFSILLTRRRRQGEERGVGGAIETFCTYQILPSLSTFRVDVTEKLHPSLILEVECAPSIRDYMSPPPLLPGVSQW